MDERRRQEVLETVAGAVGLIVDDGFVDELSRRMRVGSLGGDAPRVVRASWMLGHYPGKGPMSTGVAIRQRGGEFEGYCIATAGHVCQVETTGWKERVRFIPGLRDFGRTIAPGEEHELADLLHYECTTGRDLVIFRLDDEPQGLRSMSLPPESMDRIEDDEVYVVGHAGGRPLDVYAAKVGTRVPDGGPSLRGVNLTLVAGGVECLSGAPVFAWREGAPQLLGLVQGNFVLRAFSERAERRLKARAKDKSILGPSALRRILEEARSGLEISERVLESIDLEAARHGRVDWSCSNAVEADIYMVFLGGAFSMSFS